MKTKLKLLFLKHFRAIKYITFMLYLLLLIYNEQSRENFKNFFSSIIEFVFLQPLPEGAETPPNFFLTFFPGYDYKPAGEMFIICISILIIAAITIKLTERFRANFKDYHSMPKNHYTKGNNRFMKPREKKDRFFYQEWGDYHFDVWLAGVEDVKTIDIFGVTVYRKRIIPFQPRTETHDMKDELKEYKEK